MKTLAFTLVTLIAVPASAAITQVGDFRLSSGDVATETYFDPGFSGFSTRAVLAAPVQINSDFSGTSQNSDGNSPADAGEDVALQTFSSVTRVRQLNRFTSDLDGVGGVQRAGAVQWSFDLTPLDGYLSTNNLDLTALDLDLALIASDDTKKYDVYLSYTSASAGTTLTGIGATGEAVYSTFFLPAESSSEGSIVNNQFQIIGLDRVGDQTISDSLLSLYDEGVREFNLILSSGDFLSGRTIDVATGSGLSITTVLIPEPASLALLGLGMFALAGRPRR